MKDQKLNEYLIITLRQTVEERYQYNNVQKVANPAFIITEELVDELKSFFLQYIYPDADARIILNNAFENLEKHSKNPRHLLELMGSGISIAFKFGLQFPKALMAGFQTLESFKQAIKFEDDLYAEALAQNIKMPINTDDFEKLVSTLPISQIQDFIKNAENLFLTFTDIPLLNKTIQILTELIAKMESKPEIYDSNDIEAVRTGLKILEAGYHIFYNLTSENKKMIIELILEVENQNLDRIFKKYKR